MKTILLTFLLIASPAWAQTSVTPKPAKAARVDNCAPIGQTADRKLVYSMKCENLPAPPQPLPPPQADVRDAPLRSPKSKGAGYSAGPMNASDPASPTMKHEMSKKPLSDLNACGKDEFVGALANIFEYSPWIAEQAEASRPFGGINQLFAAMKAAVDNAPSGMQLALIKAHPDLADKTQRAAGLTAESDAEQNSVGLDRLSDDEYAAFERVNNAYQSKFDFPYIVCVRRHTKDSILRDFARRLPNDVPTERKASIAEICRIAALRLDQLVTADDRLQVTGRLSTHVLDTHSGRPAAGISIELTELSDLGASRVVARAITNSDGRTDQPLIGNRPVPIGHYELMFSVGEYFAGRDVPMSDPPFLDKIPLRFSVSDPEGHLHVPLLVTPWSYATYRGS